MSHAHKRSEPELDHLDPRHLLAGTEKYKRFVMIESYDDAPWEYFRELILSAAKFDPRHPNSNEV